MKKAGTVYLVGAGPGDVGLLTLRGAELLRRADVIVYDALVNPALLKLAAVSAEVIFGGRRAKDARDNRKSVIELLTAKAREGRSVVRLKGGDPYVFGRGGEEAEALHDAGIPFEVVSGVSAFAAVPNYAGVPLTHRDHCSQLTILAGHDDPDAPNCAVNWAVEAKNPGTKVVMMGTERIGQIAAALIKNGMSATTPVATVSWGTTGRQQSIEGTLATISDVAAKANLPAPSVTVIGDVVKLRKKLNWFERRPLFGQRIVVTRARAQAAELSSRLADLGGDVIEIPCIKTGQPSSYQPLTDALLELNSYEWLVFTSVNGVKTFFELFFRAHQDLRDIGGARLAAVGPATAAKLRELHLQVDLMPEEAIGKKIATTFSKYQNMENVKVCLLRAEAANPDLPKALEELGAIVDDIPVYTTVADTEDVARAGEDLQAHGADWLTFTSSSTVEHFHARFDLPELLKKFSQMKLASIGPETTRSLEALGLMPAIEAKEHSAEGLVAAVLKVAGRK